MEQRFVYLNTGPVPVNEALVSVYDHGFLYGDGIYETLRCYRGVVFMLEQHLDRLESSAAGLRMALPDKRTVGAAVYRTLEANRLSDAYVRITISRGAGPIGLDPALCSNITFVIMTEPFHGYPPEDYERGQTLIVARTRRNLAGAIDPRWKTLNFLNNILAKIEAKDQGAAEAIMLNSEGCLAEGSVSNIFFVSGEAMCTPSKEAGILPGITREVVMEIAKSAGIEVREGLFFPDDLRRASEVFFTNSTSEVMPVSRVDDVKYDVGPVSRRLRALYGSRVAEYIETAGRKGG